MLEARTQRVLWNPSRSAVPSPEVPARCHQTCWWPLPIPSLHCHLQHHSEWDKQGKTPQTTEAAAEVGELRDPFPRAVLWAGMVGLDDPGDLFQPHSVPCSVGACRERLTRTLAKGCPWELIHKYPLEVSPQKVRFKFAHHNSSS